MPLGYFISNGRLYKFLFFCFIWLWKSVWKKLVYTLIRSSLGVFFYSQHIHCHLLFCFFFFHSQVHFKQFFAWNTKQHFFTGSGISSTVAGEKKIKEAFREFFAVWQIPQNWLGKSGNKYGLVGAEHALLAHMTFTIAVLRYGNNSWKEYTWYDLRSGRFATYSWRTPLCNRSKNEAETINSTSVYRNAADDVCLTYQNPFLSVKNCLVFTEQVLLMAIGCLMIVGKRKTRKRFQLLFFFFWENSKVWIRIREGHWSLFAKNIHE